LSRSSASEHALITGDSRDKDRSGDPGCEVNRDDDEALRLHLVASDFRVPDEAGADTEHRSTTATPADIKLCIVLSNHACTSSLPRPSHPLPTLGILPCVPCREEALSNGTVANLAAWQPQPAITATPTRQATMFTHSTNFA
jgi:hypothetical protein